MKKTLLITSAGRRNQLQQCFRQDATILGIELNVLAADMRPEMSSACQQADATFTVPKCTDPEYVPTLLDICSREGVDFLVPTIDPELAVLSEHAVDFAQIGTSVIVSDANVITLAGDKQATALQLDRVGIPVPRTVTLLEYRNNPDILLGPVIAKPIGGSASVGIVRPKKLEDLEGLSDAGYIVQELLEGTEYTVNVFFDQAGQLCCAVPHRRIEVRSGEVSKGRTERVPVLMDAADKLSRVLTGARGALCFQAIIKDSGEAAIFEINARFGGGYPLAHHAEARFSQWLLEEICGYPSTASNEWKDGVTMLRYDAAVFLND